MSRNGLASSGPVMAKKGTPADRAKRYMSSHSMTTVVTPPAQKSRDNAARRIALALIRQDALAIERDEDRYVVRYGRPKTVIAELPRSLTEALDNEYSTGAKWSIVRLFPKQRGGTKVQVKRTAPRHGFLSTYQNESCRCPDCTAANTEATGNWRRRNNPPRPKLARKHGAGCWKFGCYCEARRKADRERQQRRRERLRAMPVAEAQKSR